MTCPSCGSELAADSQFCTFCGAAIQSDQTVPLNSHIAPPPPVAPEYSAPITLPVQYKPLGAWAYFGLQLLFSVPVVGFVFLIVFSFNGSNINRRNFARSYWCKLVIGLVILLLVILLLSATGIGAALMHELERLPL
jgi:hypothetical protein